MLDHSLTKAPLFSRAAQTDEVSAIVLDSGYSTTRAGFAGEDAPKSVVPTFYGATADGKLLFGDNAMHDPRPDVEVRNPLAGGGVDEWVADWDVAAQLWEYAITSRLTGPADNSSSSMESTTSVISSSLSGVLRSSSSSATRSGPGTPSG